MGVSDVRLGMEKCLEPWRDRNKSLGLMVGSRSANSRFRPAMLSLSLSFSLSPCLALSLSLSLSVCLSHSYYALATRGRRERIHYLTASVPPSHYLQVLYRMPTYIFGQHLHCLKLHDHMRASHSASKACNAADAYWLPKRYGGNRAKTYRGSN